MHKAGIVKYVPRELRDQQGDHESEPGFIYLSTTHPWPADDAKVAERLPDDWTEERQGARRVRRDRRKDLPELVRLNLGAPLSSLFKMQNISARRRDKINSDEEERVRLGYELQTGVRFPEHTGRPSFRTATVTVDDETVFRLTYGQAATLWRINLGWTRRQEKSQFGFVLDTERGYWAKDTTTTEDPEEPVSVRTTRVIPYVEDTRNCLFIEPATRHDLRVMASLQAALKMAIQVSFQLEDNELAAAPLPNDNKRHLLLLYEAAEGGSGVLRRLLDDPQAIANVARAALDLCHFDPVTGTDLLHAPRANEDCEAACYDCLMSYSNQREHALLDRKSVRELLLHLARARTMSSPTPEPRATHLEHLFRQTGSELEQRWLHWLDTYSYRLPDSAPVFVEACQTRPDFLYEDYHAAIYVDGPPHDYVDRQARDLQQTEAMEDYGYTVIRFSHTDDWGQVAARYPHIFGAVQTGHVMSPHEPGETIDTELDLDLFEGQWHELLCELAQELGSSIIDPGGDVALSGRVVGRYFAQVTLHSGTLQLIDAAESDLERIKDAVTGAGHVPVVVVHEQWPEAVQGIGQMSREQ
jgi:very-short-patch-repair endonuclease